MTVTRSKPGIWCDYCKQQYGTQFPKGRRQAIFTVTSVHPKSKGENRHYCWDCSVQVTEWTNGTRFPLEEQVESLLSQEELEL